MAANDLPILEFVLKNYKNFNSRATRDALIAYWRHIERGGKMFWAVAGAMSSAQLGITFGARDPRGADPRHLGAPARTSKSRSSASSRTTATKTSPTIATSPSRTTPRSSTSACAA